MLCFYICAEESLEPGMLSSLSVLLLAAAQSERARPAYEGERVRCCTCPVPFVFTVLSETSNASIALYRVSAHIVFMIVLWLSIIAVTRCRADLRIYYGWDNGLVKASDLSLS